MGTLEVRDRTSLNDCVIDKYWVFSGMGKGPKQKNKSKTKGGIEYTVPPSGLPWLNTFRPSEIAFAICFFSLALLCSTKLGATFTLLKLLSLRTCALIIIIALDTAFKEQCRNIRSQANLLFHAGTWDMAGFYDSFRSP